MAVHLRHADIGDHHVEPSGMGPDQVQSFAPVHRLEHVVAGLAQPTRRHGPDDRVVLDHQRTRPCSLAVAPVSTGGSDARPADETGRYNVKVVPFPGSLSTRMEPPL